MMMTLSSHVPPQVVTTTTCGAASYNEVGIVTILRFQGPKIRRGANVWCVSVWFATGQFDSYPSRLLHWHYDPTIPLQWRHNEHDGISNHQPHDCFLNCLFRRRSKKISKLRVTGLFAGNSPVTGEFPAQRPVTRKMFPFDDIIMSQRQWINPEYYG